MIGAVSSVDGLFMATGFSGRDSEAGLRPARLVAHMVRGEDPMVDIASLTPARFGL